VPAPVAVPRVPVPAEADVAAARKAARAKYASYYAEKKPAIQASLVKKLTDDAQAPGAMPAERFALLREAAEVSASAGDLAAATAAVAEMARRFESDENELAVAVLSASQRGMTKQSAAQWAERALELADAAVASGRYDVATKAVALSEAAARLTGGAAGAALAARGKERTASLRELRAEEARVKAAIEKLKTSPDDPDANQRAGKFYCLMANDWQRGLAALAKAPQLEMKTLAELETAAARDEAAGRNHPADARQAAGDAWWDLASREREPYASRCRQRAAHHYRQAMDAARDRETKDRLWDRVTASQQPVDLIALVDPKRDALQGTRWERRGRELGCQGMSGGTEILGFPHQPSGEYDFLIEFTAAGQGEFRQYIPGSNGACIGWHLSSYDPGFLGYDRSNHTPPARISTGPVTGRHASLIRIRKDLVRVYLDGKLAVEWETNAPAMRGGWRVGRASLGVGCTGSTSLTVHAAKLIELPHEEKSAAGAARSSSENR
jgi:hypothetical protein